MNIMKKITLSVLFLSSLSTVVSANSTAIFADEHNPNNRVLAIDYKNMELIDENPVEGSLNHHADVIGNLKNAKYFMMVPKGSTFVTFRKVSDRSFVKKLNLPFQPRSGDAYNSKYNLTLLTSSNRPSAVIIDNNTLKIVGRAGFNIACNKQTLSEVFSDSIFDTPNCTASDFGGSQISGHPIWLNSDTFAILDRSNRFVHVYGIKKVDGEWKTTLKNSIKTNSSLHQMIPDPKHKNIFYGMTEGNTNTKTLARMYKFKYTHGKLKTIGKRDLILTKGLLFFSKTYKGIGGHNLYITPDNRYLYGATATGAVFVVSTRTLSIKNAFNAGKGAGHVNFMKNGSYGAVTNHQAPYVTIFNWKTHRFVKNIYTNFDKEGIASLLHSHAPYIEGKYFYNFWTDGGVFYRINLNTLTLDNSIYVGGVPIQGNYYKSFESSESGQSDDTTITTNKKSYNKYEKVTVTYENMEGNRKDWIGIFRADSNNKWYNVVAWRWTKGREEGKAVFRYLPRGNYEVRAFFNNSYHPEASSSFTVKGWR